MAHRVKLAAVALSFGLGLAVLPGAADAQGFGNWGGWNNGGDWDGMPPHQIRRAIAEHGFRVTAPLRRNGSVFVADVVDGRGLRERLIVSASDGQILQRFLVDDGHQPGVMSRSGEMANRGDDDPDGLVPPADIPNAGRRPFGRPIEGNEPPQRLGNLGGDEGDGAPAVVPVVPQSRVMPPIRTVRPQQRPRVADRAPDVVEPRREPGAVESTPLAPPAPRPSLTAPSAVSAPAAKPTQAAVVASRPEPAVTMAPARPAVVAPSVGPSAVAAAPAAPTGQTRRPSDPLAIPGNGERDAPPVRSVSGSITGTPPRPRLRSARLEMCPSPRSTERL